MKINNISLLSFICLSLVIQKTFSFDELKISFSNLKESKYLNDELANNNFDSNLFHKKVYIEITDATDYKQLADFLKRNSILEELSLFTDSVMEPEDEEAYYDKLREGEDYLIKRVAKELKNLKKIIFNSSSYTIQKVAERIRAFNEKMSNLKTLAFNYLTIEINSANDNIKALSDAIKKSKVNLELNNIRIDADSLEKSDIFARKKEELESELYKLYSLKLFSSNIYELIYGVNHRSNRKIVSFANGEFNKIDQHFNLLDLEGAKEFNCDNSKYVASSSTFRYILKNAKTVALTNTYLFLDIFNSYKNIEINVSTFDFTGSTLDGNFEKFIKKIKKLKLNKEEGVTLILNQNNFTIDQVNLLDRLMNEDQFFTIITDAFDELS